MQHHRVGDPEPGADETEGEHGIEDDQVRADPSRRITDPLDQRRPGDEHAARDPFDADAASGLLPIEGRGVGVGAGREHRERLGVEAPPQLPEVGLDPSHLGREVVGHQQVGHPSVPTRSSRPKPPGRPPRVLDDHRVVDGQPAAQCPHRGRVGSVAHIAQRHQRVPAQMAGIATGDVPPAVGGHELRVGALEDLEEIHPGLTVGARRERGHPSVRDPVDGAHLLALVAPVDPIPQCVTVLLRKRPGRLYQPGQAPAGIEHPRRHQRPGRAGGHAARATPAPAPVGGGHRRGGGPERGVGDNRAQHRPGAEPRNEQERVLAEKAEPGPVGGGPIDQPVVVGHHPGAESLPPEGLGDHGQCPTEGGVVVPARVPGHVAGRPSGQEPDLTGGGLLMAVAPRAHDECPGPGKDPAGIGGPLRVAVGELHPPVEPETLALDQVRTGRLEHIGGGHTHGAQAGAKSEIDQDLAQIGAIRGRYRPARLRNC